MFVGAIESEFRRWFVLNLDRFKGRTIFVGCSGNFTVEQLLGSVAGQVHSNDVSIYSHFVGYHLARSKFNWRVRLPEWDWLVPYLWKNPAAAMVLLFEFLKWNEKNAYNRRIHDELRRAWDSQFDATAATVDAARERCKISSYRSSDIWDFAEEARSIDPAGVFIGFLPFYKGGYEKLYRKLDEIFEWDRPTYGVIDVERKAALIQKVKGFDYVFIDDVEYPGEEAVMVKRKTPTKSMWLYSNLDLQRVVVRPHPRVEPTQYPILEPADLEKISGKSTIVIKRVKSAEINYFRNRYLAKTIEFCDGMWNFLLFIDGKLFGFAILTRQKFGEDGLYVLSDFAVPMDKGARLAKLVLMVLQSKHFQEICQELVLAHVPKLVTTAFTDQPVSQKYRSAGFELVKRGEQEGGKKFLNYKTVTGLHSDREAIEKWMRSRKNSPSLIAC